MRRTVTSKRTDAAGTTKMLVAAVGLALGLGLGLLYGAGTAAADAFGILDEDGTFGADDVPQESRDWDLDPALHNYDTSSYPAESSWPARTFEGWPPMRLGVGGPP